jgi:osmoprotectant transport system substrate-binding protein
MNKIESAKRALILVLLPALVLAACSPISASSGTGSSKGTIIVGSKNFTEEFIVANMYADLLENAGFTVQRKLNLGGTPVAQAAILKGEIDLYPEYTSTGLLTVLKEQPIQDPTQVYNAVKSGYEKQFNLTWLDPAPFNDTQALAMTQAGSNKYGITTFSELATKAPELILGGPAEFQARQDGLPLLQAKYGGFQFKEYKQLGTGSLRYQALLDGQVDVVVAFSTDGQIEGDHLVLLQDDKHVYPVYQIAPVVRMDTLQKYPEIATVLNKLAPKLTTSIMSGLNWQVDGPSHQDPAAVAKTFLQDQGLLPK